MGFFKSCWEILTQLTSYTLLSDLAQHPLPLSQQPLSSEIIVQPHQGSRGFKCSYPGWESCNGPNSRDCWIKKKGVKQPLWNSLTIDTDYEDIIPKGVKREYWLEVTEQQISPDGYLKPLGKTFNGSYPGPLIEACWGDDIVVHVTNKIFENGTTIHWHGVRQLHSNEMDGVNGSLKILTASTHQLTAVGVTQCPIAYQEKFTYRFKAWQYGHSWYHSHYSLQYPDGVAGPLLIHGPTSANWDEAWDPIIITDWVHESAFAAFQQELNGGVPLTDSILLNGTGQFNCSSSDSNCKGGNVQHFEKTFVKGKKYLLRLINGSAGANFIFSIDGHRLQVVSNDFVAIKPYLTDSLPIGIGERYSVIVEANPNTTTADGNYWIRTQVPTKVVAPGGPGACGNVRTNGSDERRGIIRYNPQSTLLPTSPKNSYAEDNCLDEPTDNLKPVVKWHVEQPQNNVTLNTYEAGISNQPFHGFQRWEFTDVPLWLNFSNPTILNLRNKTFDPQYCVVPYDYNHGWVYLVVTGNLSRLGVDRAEVPAGHPIHLHGHDFAILAQSNDTYNETTSPASFKFDNPPRRDVAILPSGGYLAIAFKPDNPGVWVLHCHIAWHASSGLALQILEQQEEILSSIGTLAETKNSCSGWDNYLKSAGPIDQDDSGI